MIGAAAGVMWKQAFVDGKDSSGQPVYMRDKLAVWREVGQRAGLLEAERVPSVAAAGALGGLLGLALGLAAQRGDVVDAVATDDATEAEE